MREDKKYVLTAGLAAQTHKWPSRNQIGGSSVTFKLLSGSHYKNRHLNKTMVLGQSSQFPLFWCTKSRKSCLTRWWIGGVTASGNWSYELPEEQEMETPFPFRKSPCEPHPFLQYFVQLVHDLELSCCPYGISVSLIIPEKPKENEDWRAQICLKCSGTGMLCWGPSGI